MILKGEKKQLSLLPLVLYIGLGLLFIIGWKYLTIKEYYVVDEHVIYCDAETVKDGQFITRDASFRNGNTQSSKEAHSGKYSCHLNKNHQYGMSYTYDTPKSGVKYVATIWVKTEYSKNSKLVIKSPDGKYVIESMDFINNEDGGWSQIQASLILPDNAKAEKLLIFPYITDLQTEAYFDDLVFYEENKKTLFNGISHSLKLYLDKKALDKINAKRSHALKIGLLQSSDDDWVNGKMTVGDSVQHKVKLRLKGDWTDHLKGDYWSYRIKMPSDQSWNRLQTFSLQNPKTRDYLSEWLYHKILADEDIITPRYGFVKLSQNEKQPILYAYEEHFEKQIAEYRNRREGVILKFGEDALWDERTKNTGSNKMNVYHGGIDHADIQTFKEGKTLKSPKLKEQFQHGADLLNGYQFQTLPVSEIFDLDKMAKLYALAEVLEAYHGLIWHNQRFYYNPIVKKLEPIGFDGYTDSGPFIIYNKMFFGEFKTGPALSNHYAHYQYLFKDKEFNKLYTQYLKKYTSVDFINQIEEKHFDELLELQFLINKTKPKYNYDRNALVKRADKLRRNLAAVDDFSMVAYKGMENNTKGNTSISNRHPLPLEVIGTGVTRSKIDNPISDRLVYSGPLKGVPVFEDLNVPDEHKYIFYRLAGDDQYFSTLIKPYRNPSNTNLGTITSDQLSIPISKESYTIVDKMLTIKTGQYALNSPLILPKGYNLNILPGTTLDMVNKSYLLCYGNVQINGSKDNPITITSSDKSSQGFIALGTNTISELSYVTFSNLGALEEGTWQLTGAVTIYESGVTLDHVTVTSNSCEDALNLVRSNFDITALNINNTFADGFDGDFCKGVIRDSYFYKTGNDGIDYSGSHVTIKNVKLDQIGDKGISAGEEATLVVNNTTVDGAQIGIASKDLSTVTVNGLTIKNCAQGFAAYRKKPEFGGGYIKVNSYEAIAVKKLILTDAESKIILPD